MPARFGDIARALRKLGVQVEEPSKGSHWKCRKDGFGVYTIPAHNGLKAEISDVYIRAVCRHFEIDLEEFKRTF